MDKLKPVILILALFPFLLLGQSKKFEFGLMVGNNGQLDNTLDDFYIYQYGFRFVPVGLVSNKTNIKYSASAMYFFNKHLSARIKFGKMIKKELFTTSGQSYFVDFDIRQTISNISPSIGFSKRFDKFELMGGVEIPLMFVGNYIVNNNTRYRPDSVKWWNDHLDRESTSGGFVWGFNQFIRVKYALTDCLSFGSEISNGLLFAKLGNKYTREYAETSSSPLTTSFEYKKTYKKTYFSPPEISIGLFFQIGKHITKS